MKSIYPGQGVGVVCQIYLFIYLVSDSLTERRLAIAELTLESTCRRHLPIGGEAIAIAVMHWKIFIRGGIGNSISQGLTM